MSDQQAPSEHTAELTPVQEAWNRNRSTVGDATYFTVRGFTAGYHAGLLAQQAALREALDVVRLLPCPRYGVEQCRDVLEDEQDFCRRCSLLARHRPAPPAPEAEEGEAP